MDLSELQPPILRAAMALVKEEGFAAVADAERDAILSDLKSASSSDEFIQALNRIIAYASWDSGKTQDQMRELAGKAQALKQEYVKVQKATGTSEGGLLAGALGPTEEGEITPFGEHKRKLYTEVPESEATLGANRLGSLEARMAVLERDVAAMLYEIKRLKA